VIHLRADAAKPLMGLHSTRADGIIRKDDVSIAKNYLNEEELHTLNRIVSAYIEFAELQALSRAPMTMQDWITKLDEFLKLSGRELLGHAGKISAEDAKANAEREYERYRKFLDAQPRRVDADFDRATKEVQKLPRPPRPPPTSRQAPETEEARQAREGRTGVNEADTVPGTSYHRESCDSNLTH